MTPVKREFPQKKFQPEKCSETFMISYLFDTYERVHSEERISAKVGIEKIK